ncbi:MAG: hypothetical protein HYV08_01235 [Deltaproteobacteria bacterium]|nr:hypothetical protein [Deltaproteobacteria bacterium]
MSPPPIPALILVLLNVLNQMVVGGVATLGLVPAAVSGTFFKTSAGIYLGLSALVLWAWWASGGHDRAVAQHQAELLALVAFTLALGLYTASLWSRGRRLQARLHRLCSAVGAGALIVTSQRYAGPSLLTSSLFLPAVFLSSALFLGMALTSMLLGHWYLVGKLDEAYIRRLADLFIGATALQGLLPLVHLAVSGAAGGHPLASLAPYLTLVAVRWGVGILGVFVLAVMIRQTLKIPHVQAATGLFYVAIVVAFVGELLGRVILFYSAVPF